MDDDWNDRYDEHPIGTRLGTSAFASVDSSGCGWFLFVVLALCVTGLIVELAVPGGVAEVIRRLGGS